jgi:hypothetical protein
MIAAETNYLNPIQPETHQAQIGAFLQEHSEIETIAPVILGVLITSRFHLRGANALMANLLIASLARQLFTQLKQPAAVQVATRQNYAADGGRIPNALGNYAIAHSVPGRIRLRVPRLASDRDRNPDRHLLLHATVFLNRGQNFFRFYGFGEKVCSSNHLRAHPVNQSVVARQNNHGNVLELRHAADLSADFVAIGNGHG